PLWPKQSIRRADTDFVRSEFRCVAKRKICGNNCRSNTALFEKMGEHLFIGRRLFRFSLHLPLEFAEHDELIRIGLFATAIDFQIAQDQRALAVAREKNKWNGRPKLRRVKH